MLTITIPGDESWDNENEIFCYSDPVTLQFEHSLVSLSKWEAIHHKPFLTDDKKTEEEMVGYIEAMLVTPDVDRETLNRMSLENVEAIDAYINDPHTGSTVSELEKTGPRTSERLSAELIYFWMDHYRIDYEARYWHLNRLFMLIKIHHAKSQPPKKMNRGDHIRKMAEENQRRLREMGTTG